MQLVSSRWRALSARGVDLSFPYFLAPMVGLSHTALRQTVHAYLPEDARTLLFTEMLSSRRLPGETIGDRPETAFSVSEGALVPQLLANEERFISASLAKLERMRPVAVDINMGCPVNEALRQNWGVALMADLRGAEHVVRTAVRLSSRPVSVKIRTGMRDDPAYLVEFGQMLETSGAAWITLHPRLAVQKRRGSAHWEYIARVRDAVKIPVIGNGDVQTALDALTMQRETGCDGVMIGRAAVARPWIFWQIGQALGLAPPSGRSGEAAPMDRYAEGREFGRALETFLDIADLHFARPDTLKRLRFLLEWSTRWLDFGHELWRRMTRAPDLEAARDVAARFFSVPQRMAERSALA